MLAREEVCQDIFEYLCRQYRSNILSPPFALWLQQFHIEIPCHQQFVAPGALLERGDNTLYCRGVVGGEVTSDDLPLPRSHRELETDDVRAKLVHGFHHKKW